MQTLTPKEAAENKALAITGNTSVMSPSQLKDIRLQLQSFSEALNKKPKESELDKTPDGKAQTLPISFVEMTLDEMFFGLWSTENFKWSAIANEVQGSLELVVTHPVTFKEIRRIGAGSIVITVDKVPEELKDNPQEKNRWALDPSNKKSNSLDLGFPKLKAECLKNAAQSLGQIFGRDINRKRSDVYKPLLKTEKTNERIMLLIEDATTSQGLEEALRGTLLSPEQTEAYQNKFIQLTSK